MIMNSWYCGREWLLKFGIRVVKKYDVKAGFYGSKELKIKNSRHKNRDQS